MQASIYQEIGRLMGEIDWVKELLDWADAARDTTRLSQAQHSPPVCAAGAIPVELIVRAGARERGLSC